MSKDIETNRPLSFLKNFKKKLFSYFQLKEFHITLYLQGTIILRHVYHNIHFLKDFFLLKGMVLGMLNRYIILTATPTVLEHIYHCD